MSDISEKIKLNEDVLDSFEADLGIPKVEAPGSDEELQRYMTMNRDIMERLTPEETWQISVRLSQFATYVTRTINRKKALVVYLNNEINRVVASEIKQYDKFTKHDVKVEQICRTNTYGIELLRAKSYADQVVQRLEELASSIKNLSYVISLGYRLKIGERE